MKYNLVDEPWICLLDMDSKVKKKGLKEVFLHLRDYRDVCGDIRLQDMAILRLLVAISVTLLYRYDEHGKEKMLEGADEALSRVSAVWQSGFNQKAVETYFHEWYNRFDLFDDSRPFFQIPLQGLKWLDDKDVPGGKKPVCSNGVYANWMPMSYLNGRILGSRNKPSTPYKGVFGKAADEVSYDEAARWLIYYNAYADCSVGKMQHYKDQSGKNQSANAAMTLPSRGSLVTPVGRNLLETILLSSVLFHPARRELYKTVHPVWEEDLPSETEYITKTPVPNDLPRMYTQQARRMHLVKGDEGVIGAFVFAGESYTPELLWMDPAFMMREVKRKEDGLIVLMPMQCNNDTDIWEEVAHIAGDKGAAITQWTNLLEDELYDASLITDDVIPCKITGIRYGSASCGVESMINDNIILGRQFVKDTDMQEAAVNEISVINKISFAIRIYGDDCTKCMGLPGKSSKDGKSLSRQYHNAIGYVIRQYIAGGIGLEKLQNAEFDLAKKVTDDYVKRNIEAFLHGKLSHDGMHLGMASKKLEMTLMKIKKRKG